MGKIWRWMVTMAAMWMDVIPLKCTLKKVKVVTFITSKQFKLPGKPPFYKSSSNLQTYLRMYHKSGLRTPQSGERAPAHQSWGGLEVSLQNSLQTAAAAQQRAPDCPNVKSKVSFVPYWPLRVALRIICFFSSTIAMATRVRPRPLVPQHWAPNRH